MAYEILVLDIDGTLTTSEKNISPKTYQAIQTIQKRGHKVVLASGRPTPGVCPFAEQLHLAEYGGYILSYNGAKITNCQTGEIIYQKTLPSSVIPDLYQMTLSHHVGIVTYSSDTILAGTPVDSYMELESRINHIPIQTVPDFVSAIDFPVNKCLMTGEPAHMAELELLLKDHFHGQLNIFRSEPFFIEVMPQQVDKADSLCKLLEHLGLDREQMISCGDGYNDLTMIQYAGMGVAMANAQSVVKKAADYVTTSNDQDGVANVIQKFMLTDPFEQSAS